MISKIRYDPRYTPDEEVLRKIELSMMEVENMEKRDLKCPICGFRIQGVYSDNDRHGHAEVKCRKCKFEGPLNLAYFRRQRRHHYSVGRISCEEKTVIR